MVTQGGVHAPPLTYAIELRAGENSPWMRNVLLSYDELPRRSDATTVTLLANWGADNVRCVKIVSRVTDIGVETTEETVAFG